MNWQEVAQLPREKLLVLLEDTLRNLVRIDGYWFLGMESRCGQEPAVRVDEEVWGRFGKVEARQIRKFHNLGDGLTDLVAALRLIPSWTFFGDYSVEQTSPRQAVLKVNLCQSQKERVRMGLGVFPCRGVEENYFGSFAREINPQVQVQCLSCPPDNYREDLWCSWQFSLEGK